MPEKNKKINYVNYVRKPLGRRSFWAAGITAVALVLFGSVVGLAVKSQGNVLLNVGAMAFSSFLFAAFGLGYGVWALQEKEKNYILAKIAMILDGLLLLVWVITMIIGLRQM
ncbi:MAG TPA: calcium:proton exchanger [Candidatus Cottocaccamicrobium excrementipullorum]|mgnify:FL=1|nr:calcium:proton exchanger [Candidatus Cottocaccamicrobium excrementipullorum]